jgi:hypothetical protein
LQAFLTQIILDELADFPSTLSDQGQDHDIASRAAGEHGEKSRFPDARASEKAQPLPLPAGCETVQGANAEFDSRSDAAALVGVWRGWPGKPGGMAWDQQATPIDGSAQRVNDATKPGVADRQHCAVIAVEADSGSPAHAIERFECHDLNDITVKANDLSGQLVAGAVQEFDAIALGRDALQSRDVDHEALEIGDHALGQIAAVLLQTVASERKSIVETKMTF